MHPHPGGFWWQDSVMGWGIGSGADIAGVDMCAWGGERGRHRFGVAMNPPLLQHLAPMIHRTCQHRLGHDTHLIGREGGAALTGRAGSERPAAFDQALWAGIQQLPVRERKSVGRKKKARAMCRAPWEERIGDLAEVLPWKAIRSYKESGTRGEELPHINILELKARCGIARRLARRVGTHHSKVITLGDSRAALGAAARGRSSSWRMNRELLRHLPDLLGGNVWITSFWVESARNPADHPSRYRCIPDPARAVGRMRAFVNGLGPLLTQEEVQAWERGEWQQKPPPPLHREEVDFGAL